MDTSAFQTTCQDIDGQPTQILLQAFADRILVLVTQVGKVGNLIQANMRPTALASPPPEAETEKGPGSLPQPSPAIQLTPLLGSHASEHYQALHSLYASQIATIIWDMTAQFSMGGSRRSVIVGIALQRGVESGPGCELSDAERKTFRGVMTMLQGLLKGQGSKDSP